MPTGPHAGGSIEIRDRQILIDGRPELIFSAEIHYFRLHRSDWADRLRLVREAGCNAVASYIPWLCHETERGRVDLTGRTRPELDLAGFIDLCGEMGLMFLARPGPFVMAELKNEGLPYWLLQRTPRAYDRSPGTACPGLAIPSTIWRRRSYARCAVGTALRCPSLLRGRGQRAATSLVCSWTTRSGCSRGSTIHPSSATAPLVDFVALAARDLRARRAVPTLSDRSCKPDRNQDGNKVASRGTGVVG